MNTTYGARAQIDGYLEQLRSSLRSLPAEQADDIAREIRSHLVDSAERNGELDPRLLADAITRLGDPATLAGAYVMDNLALRAQVTRSPFLLLRMVSLWATRSFEGVVALAVAFIGYGAALIALGCALFKPFMPQRIGLWVRELTPGDPTYQLGRVSVPPTDARELLGWYIIPLGLIAGAGFLVLTTRYLLAKVRKYRRGRAQEGAAQVRHP
jgi:hypothetical protein